MAQSDARFGYRAKLGRDSHDLSQPLGFTAAPGLLLPVWFDWASPGDSYYMSHDMPLLRSIQLIAPSMVDVKVHFETFFVPLQMIFQPGENVLENIKPLQSSMFQSGGLLPGSDFPVMDYQSFCNQLTSLVSSSFRMDFFRLADLLELQPLNMCTETESEFYPSKYAPNFFPWSLLAYHTIFNYYYRLDDKTEFSNIECNWDQHYATQVVTPSLGFALVHRRPWDFDYFTSMYRSPIVSDLNTLQILPNDKYSSLTDSQTLALDQAGNYASVNNNATSFGSLFSSTFSHVDIRKNVSTAAIRQMFANEKLAMITGRARKNYDSQILAHYGVKVPHDVKHDLTMVHRDTYELNVMEVTSLAATTDAPLGELAGKSYARGNGKQFKFEAPCHGVMMTIFSVEPKKKYVTGFGRVNSVFSAFDFPIPEYDRLGNVPMYRYECSYDKQAEGTFHNYDIIGWKERYYQFKRKPARVTWASYGANGVNNFAAYFITSMPFAQGGIYGPGVSQPVRSFPRPDQADRFYIEPSCLDMQCHAAYLSSWQETDAENWSNKPWLVYARDPFIIDSYIKCKKVSWMSKDGEPIYD